MDFLNPEERVAFTLRQLYRSYGYCQFRMSKFEDYDYYVKNKSFLVSDAIITFTDSNGKLKALKPDVTLSIVRNAKDSETGVQKVYYHENVYRPAQGSRNFREIPQVGLECIGEVDDYTIAEVLSLAEQSLSKISPEGILMISHLGLLSELISRAGFPEEIQREVVRLIGEKNLGELEELAKENGLSSEQTEKLFAALPERGTVSESLDYLDGCYRDEKWKLSVAELRRVTEVLPGDRTRIDFSVTGNQHYYNGIVFHGYVEGLPGRILSGGQYDKLMEKLGKNARAIGFAVYLDGIDRLNPMADDSSHDTLVVYREGTDLSLVMKTVQEQITKGYRAVAVTKVPQNETEKRVLYVGRE